MIGPPPLARVMGVGRQQQHLTHQEWEDLFGESDDEDFEGIV